jgi:protein O-mannosyl-transferase
LHWHDLFEVPAGKLPLIARVENKIVKLRFGGAFFLGRSALHFLTKMRLRSMLPLLGLCLLTAGAYWGGIHGNFVFDDVAGVVNNRSLRGLDGSLQSLVTAATSGNSSPLGRPLSMASFALNFAFFGDSPFSFKLANLLIHLVDGMLIFVLARQVLRAQGYGVQTNRSLLPAMAVAAAWLLHPINLTPVLLVIQRMTSLSGLFVLAALVLYLYGRQARGKHGVFAIAAALFVCWPAAVLSKETGLLLPIYVFLCEWLVLGTFRSIPAGKKWFALSLVCGLFAVLCAVEWSFITQGYSVRDFGLGERLLTEPRVLWFYVSQLMLPAPEAFALFHDDIAISHGLLDPPQTLFAIAAWTAVGASAFRWRTRYPLFAFAVFWFLASHLLESTALPLEIAYEHRNYIASFGLFLWLASLLFPDRLAVPGYAPRLVLAASFAFLCGLLTSIRSLQWEDEFQRAQVEVAYHPLSARANYQAAAATMQRTFESGGGNPMAYQMVQFYYKRAADLDKSSKAPLIGLVYLDCANGLRNDPAVRTALLRRFSTERFTLGDRAVVQSLSGLLVEGRLCMDDQQVKSLIDAALSNPAADGSMRGLINAVGMDYAAANMHSIPVALAYAQAAVASDPGNVALRSNLIHLLLRANRVDDARHEYMILAESPHPARDSPVLNELKTLFEAIGNGANANKQVG